MAESGEKDLTQSGDIDVGGEEEASDEKYYRLLQEVYDLGAKVTDYREKGPGEFAALVESSLSAFRQLPIVDSALADASGVSANEENKFSELTAHKVNLTQRLEAAAESLPTLLKELKDCTTRLDNLIAIMMQ